MRLFPLFFLFLTIGVYGQDNAPLQLIIPANVDLNGIKEGEMLQFKLSATGGTDKNYRFGGYSEDVSDIRIDEDGRFIWNVAYDVVPRNRSERKINVTFGVVNDSQESDTIVSYMTVYNTVIQPMTSSYLEFNFPKKIGWNLLNEGDTLAFKLNVVQGNEIVEGFRYYIEGARETNISLDTLGNFLWVPDYDYVDRLEQTRDKHVVFIGENKEGEVISEKVVLTVFHKNRPPVVKPLPAVYAKAGVENVFEINEDYFTDPDGDPVVFVPIPSEMPQGASLTSQGRFSWKPSRRQFLSLVREPAKVSFYIEDQPSKERTKASFMIEASELDLPPEITLVPLDSAFTINEDQFLNINFYLSDPNGDDDIRTFDFVSEDIRVTKDNLRKNTDNQYEFVWKPGYDFVEDPHEEISFNIRFFAFDKTNKTTEKLINVTVKDAPDLVKLDRELYDKYYEVLSRSLNLLDQLDNNLEQLEKRLRRAKSGKKNRALFGAGVGAITGLSPVVFQDPDLSGTQKVVSGVGGTTTMTLGTLEAKNAIGTTLDEINEKIKINVQLRNKVQQEGNSFARRYNSKAARRSNAFEPDIDELFRMFNSEELVKLELDASWENSKKINNRRLKQAFTDFSVYEGE